MVEYFFICAFLGPPGPGLGRWFLSSKILSKCTCTKYGHKSIKDSQQASNIVQTKCRSVITGFNKTTLLSHQSCKDQFFNTCYLHQSKTAATGVVLCDIFITLPLAFTSTPFEPKPGSFLQDASLGFEQITKQF